MEDYPRTLAEFDARFAPEDACRAYLVQLRWPDGFRCPCCGGTTAWPVRTVLWQCARCRRQTFGDRGHGVSGHADAADDLAAGDVGVTSSKTGTSALALPTGTGPRYRTAWAWLHKLRRAMVRPGRERLGGYVEVDESFVGGLGGAHGRSPATKALIGRGGRGGRARYEADPYAPWLAA